MSRALESGLQISSTGDASLKAYKDLVAALSNSSASNLLEIEFLGKSHDMPGGCNVLVDGHNIGISKKKLIQAFTVARQLFFNYIKNLRNSNYDDVRNATSIMLLMDAENLTAANTRKRLIQFYHGDELEKFLKQELQWVDSLLTSRLHRHTKSPTLWGHRRWIIEVSQSTNIPHDVHSDLKNIIFVAAERHPRNYYAWLHIRWLLQAFYDRNSTANSKLHLDKSVFLSTVLDWCLRHPSDTSGFSFLTFCLSWFSEDPTSRAKLCNRVLDLAVSFQWVHESVWVFLRTVVAHGETQELMSGYLGSLDSILASQPQNKNANVVLSRARSWCIQYQQTPLLQTRKFEEHT